MRSTHKAIFGRLLLKSVLFTLVTLLAVGQLQAQDMRAIAVELVCTATQLNPDNDISETITGVTPDYLALMRDDGQDWEIFVQNRSTGVVTQITDNTHDDWNPAIDGQYVVWPFENPASGTKDIALHNILTGTTEIISDSPTEETTAFIEGEHVVWARNGDTSSVAHYNVATGVTETVDVRHVGKHYFEVNGISNGKVLYHHYGIMSKTFNLHVYDIQTDQKTLVSEGVPQSDQKSAYHIQGDVVVWQNQPTGSEAASREIYAFHLGTETLTRITNNDVADRSPMSHGDYIVYRQSKLGEGDEIHLYNLQTGHTRVLSTGIEFGKPFINGMRVAWGSTDGIYVYDIPTGISAKVSDYAKTTGLILEGSLIFWNQTLSSEETNVYMAKCEFPAQIVQMLPNADFEVDADNDKLPDGWLAKGTTLDKSDKLKRNKLKADGSIKQFAYSGEAAFMFRGNPDGQKSKLQYKVSEVGTVTHGSTLEFSAYVNRFNIAPGIQIGKVKIKFSDGSKGTLQLVAPAIQGYTSVSDSVVIDLNGRQIEQIKVQFNTNLTSGKFLIDAASLLMIPTGALQTNLVPLP